MSTEESTRTDRRAFIKATGALGAGAGLALAASAPAAAETGPGSGIDQIDGVGPVTILNPGVWTNWWFDIGGADRHVVIAGPNILQPFNGAKHTFYNFGKAIFANGYVQYYVTIRNDGGAAANHNLEGGGLT